MDGPGTSAAPAVPLAYLTVHACCLVSVACMRMLVLGSFAHQAAASPGEAAVLVFWQEAGVFAAVLLARLATPDWQRIVLWASIAMAAVGVVSALAWQPMAGSAQALRMVAFASSVATGFVQPALARGAYDYVRRDNATPLVRRLGIIDALVQMAGPAVCGALITALGPESVFALLGTVMAASALAAMGLRRPAAIVGRDGDAVVTLPAEGRLPSRLAILIAVALVEYLLIGAFFAAFASRSVAAGWSAGQLGMASSTVYAGALVAMMCPVPASSAYRWAMFLLAACLVPATIRLGFIWADGAAYSTQLALLFATGMAIGVEQLLFGALKLKLVAASQAAGLQRLLMSGAALAGMAGAGLSAFGMTVSAAGWGLQASVAAGVAIFCAACIGLWLTRRHASSAVLPHFAKPVSRD